MCESDGTDTRGSGSVSSSVLLSLRLRGQALGLSEPRCPLLQTQADLRSWVRNVTCPLSLDPGRFEVTGEKRYLHESMFPACLGQATPCMCVCVCAHVRMCPGVPCPGCESRGRSRNHSDHAHFSPLVPELCLWSWKFCDTPGRTERPGDRAGPSLLNRAPWPAWVAPLRRGRDAGKGLYSAAER